MGSEEMSAANLGDRHRKTEAIAALAVALFFAASAAEHVATTGLADLFHWTARGMIGVAVLLVLPIVIWKIRSGREARSDLYRGHGGFVSDIVARAQMTSWAVTFVVLVALSRLGDRLETLPPEFAFEVVLAIMLAAFSISFLVLDRGSSDEVSGD